METFANWRQAKQYIFIGEKDGKKKKRKKMFALNVYKTHVVQTNILLGCRIL